MLVPQMREGRSQTLLLNRSMKRYFFLALYYGIAYWLPSSFSGLGGGRKLRAYCCRHLFKMCGKNVNVERKASFGSGRDIMLGDNSGIGVDCSIPVGTVIGKNVMMAPQCVLLQSSSHRYDSTDIPMCEQGTKENGKIIIEDDCWIGTRSIIIAGRTIKKGSILAAGTVLVKDFPEYSIIGGNPSVLIRSRKRDETKQ